MTDHTPPSSDARTAPNTFRDLAETAGGDRIAALQVEPDPRSAELLEAFAARLSDRVRVRSVDRFADAIDAIETGVEVDGDEVAVDCVVTEQHLPDGDGVALTERLRGAGRRLPIVFHTTCLSEECGAVASGAGANAYFEKGTERGRFEAILDRIRALVDERRDGETDVEAAAASTPQTLGTPDEPLRSEE